MVTATRNSLKHPKVVLYSTRHYYAKLQLFKVKKQQYTLLAVPNVSVQNQHQAAQLARDAVRYAEKWRKYLDFIPVEPL